MSGLLGLIQSAGSRRLRSAAECIPRLAAVGRFQHTVLAMYDDVRILRSTAGMTGRRRRCGPPAGCRSSRAHHVSPASIGARMPGRSHDAYRRPGSAGGDRHFSACVTFPSPFVNVRQFVRRSRLKMPPFVPVHAAFPTDLAGFPERRVTRSRDWRDRYPRHTLPCSHPCRTPSGMSARRPVDRKCPRSCWDRTVAEDGHEKRFGSRGSTADLRDLLAVRGRPRWVQVLPASVDL